MEDLYFFRKVLSDISNIHPENIRDKSLSAGKYEYEIKDGAVIAIGPSAGKILRKAAEDFADYLFVSQGVSVRISRLNVGDITFTFLKNEDVAGLSGKAYSVSVENGIEIRAYDERGFAQALYKLEYFMTAKKSPFLKKGIREFKPLFSPRMVHSALGLDTYPDGYLLKLAHSGIDAILISVRGVNDTHGGFVDFNELCGRAETYGIDVYAYSQMRSEIHPDDASAEDYYESRYGEIFAACPALKGIILVGESIMFPSKDPDTSGVVEFMTKDYEIPSSKPNPGWWPCKDYPELVGLIKKTVRNHSPKAEIIFWTYNWGYAPEAERIRLINELPEDICLLATFEMFEKYKVGKADGYCADYTLTFAGPGKYFLSEAKAASEKGIKLYAMANTAGKTWDFGCAPYEPMPYQWIKRIEGLKHCSEKYNLSGVMESHTYGLYPSLVSDLVNLSFSMPDADCEKLLSLVLEARFGGENVIIMKKALKLWSKAITFYTPTNEDQYGAFRIGPAYPFSFIKKFLPEPNTSRAVVDGMVMPDYEFPYLDFSSPPSLRIDSEIASLKKMKKFIDEGISILDDNREGKNEEYLKLVNLGRYLSRTVQTGINAKKWHVLKAKIKTENKKEKIISLISEAKELLCEEYDNAISAIPLAEKDSSIGYEPTMDYLGDAEHIKWKLRQLRYVIDTELVEYEKRVNFNLM